MGLLLLLKHPILLIENQKLGSLRRVKCKKSYSPQNSQTKDFEKKKKF